ncbi:MAG TPA: maltotransferase domain-containing protein, partial [Polyangiales bacterium]|nr:maltotransferase domain-containing protein [Polyangiales bacterium]
MSKPARAPAVTPLPDAGARRIVIENLTPQVDGGRFAVKRTLGDRVVVEADVFTDGHDCVACDLLHRAEGAAQWQRAPMSALGNDRWRASFDVDKLGRHRYTVEAWVDHLQTWRRDLAKKFAAQQDVSVELARGAELIDASAARAGKQDRQPLERWKQNLSDPRLSIDERVALAQSEELHGRARGYPDPTLVLRQEPMLALEVDRERARFSSWYELFPRSTAAVSEAHGTFADCEARLPYVAGMGFDVLYLPPIHPIGSSERKGPNNRPSTHPGDPGSPWAIGSAAGGHKSIDPQLGTLADFRRLVQRSRALGLEIALDIAFQCSPDHPYVREHPEWFLHRPDGTIQYAENPPKKYQDIYPFHFETPAWR